MTAGLDSSFVLRLLTGMPEALAEAALQEVQARLSRGDTLLVCDLVVSEVYFALQHHYGMPKAEAIEVLSGFVQTKGLRCLGDAAAVLRTPGLATANPGLVDRLIHAEYRRHAGEMLTFEKAAGRLSGARVLS
jgi:predicted nucleic acid-binding protein